jgi:hypothetical protein
MKTFVAAGALCLCTPGLMAFVKKTGSKAWKQKGANNAI